MLPEHHSESLALEIGGSSGSFCLDLNDYFTNYSILYPHFYDTNSFKNVFVGKSYRYNYSTTI